EGVSIIQYDGLTVDICRQMGIRHIVRGVRNMTDFDNEQAIADANRHLAPEIETIIIPTSQDYSHISSSAVRDVVRHHGDLSQFIPAGVVLPDVE
ncbi:MAG: pantetheine-phosphate adenylyltransferase, partial [Bacteroidales bacterium]|nr:pantetheine-phosphate adenylyltransferase [Bacteroidales bacterium]